MTLDAFLELLEDVKPAGNGWVALCPAHEDRAASLGVTDSDDKILVTCHAGCETRAVVDALGLEWSDLFTGSTSVKKDQEPEAVYTYTDEAGNELFQAVRFPGKQFRQRHHDPFNEKTDGEGWVWNLEDVRRVPYQLPDLLAAVKVGVTIYICEGEKDVEALRAVGKVATCNPMGAGKWRPEFAVFFRGHTGDVVIVADKDEPGRNHAEAVKKSLLTELSADKVFIVQARIGKDATDHLEAGHSVAEFKVLRAQRRGVVSSRELAEHARDRLTMSENDLPGYVMSPGVPGLGDLVFRQGRMYAIGAYTGHGKTCFALQGYRALSSAGRRVGYFSLEMPEMDLMNRLVAHRGVPLAYTESPWRLRDAPEMLTAYNAAVDEVEGWHSDIIFESSANAEFIRERTMDGEYEAIFVDHLHRFTWSDRGKLEGQVKSLTNIALDLNVMVVVLCQLRKYTRGKDFDVYPRPTEQDFRETSMISDDASMALAVWRQKHADGVSFTGATEVIVLKNRHTTGDKDAAGKSWLPTFDPQRQLFVPTTAGGW